MSECTRYADDLKALVDGELPFARRWAVERHVADCESCRGEVAAMRQIGEGLRMQPLEPLDPALRDRILAAIPEASVNRSRHPIPRRFPLAVAGSAAAIALLVFLFNPAHQQFMQDAAAPAHKSEFAPAGPAAAPPAPMASQKVKEGGVPARTELRKVQKAHADRFAETPHERPIRRRPAPTPLHVQDQQDQAVKEPFDALQVTHPTEAQSQSQVAAKAPSYQKMEPLEKKSNLSEQTAGAKFDASADGAGRSLQAPALTLRAQNAPAPPPVPSQATTGKNLQQLRDMSKEGLATGGSRAPSQQGGMAGGAGIGGAGGRAGGFGGGLGAGGFGGGGFGRPGAENQSSRQEAQRNAPVPQALGAIGPRGPQGEQSPAGAVNNATAFGAQRNAAARTFAREAEVRAQPAPTTALLGLEVENVDEKRGEIDQIARSVNGTLTEVAGGPHKDVNSFYALPTPLASGTELRLEVDPKKMSGVLDRLSKLGEVTVRQVPAPARQDENLAAEQGSTLDYRYQDMERANRGVSRNLQGVRELRQERARRFGEADKKQPRLKSGAQMGRPAAPTVGATITVLLKEKKEKKPAAAAKPAQQPRRK